MRPHGISRSSLTMNQIWTVRGRRPTLRRTCKVYIPRDLSKLDMLRLPAVYEEDNFLIQKLKTITKHKLHHLILILAISCYLYFGAILFQHLEINYGKEPTFNVSKSREELFKNIYQVSVSNLGEGDWIKQAQTAMQSYENTLLEAGKQGYNGENKNHKSNIWNTRMSLFFCFTVITTIGYGNIKPSTDVARGLTVVYAFIGIPLMILVLADLGKLFTKAMKFVFGYFRRFYKTGTFSKIKAAEITENKPLQYMTVSWRSVKPNPHEDDPPSTSSVNSFPYNQVTTLTLHNDDLYKNLDFLNPDEKNHKHVEVDDDFNLPVTLAVALVITYMIIGGFLFAMWEKWSFFEAFYFVFISLTTVGFGDYVPTHENYIMCSFAYLVIGLMLTSMCINVIQEKLSAIFQKHKVRIGNNTMLDVNTLLTDDDHRSRSLKSKNSDIEKSGKCLGLKMVLHKNSICEPLNLLQKQNQKLYESKLKYTEEGKSDNDSTIFQKNPLQSRFTFYDSPYTTIQDENSGSFLKSIKY